MKKKTNQFTKYNQRKEYNTKEYNTKEYNTKEYDTKDYDRGFDEEFADEFDDEVYDDEVYDDEVYDDDYDGEEEYYEEEYDEETYYVEEEGEYEDDEYYESEEYAEDDTYYEEDYYEADEYADEEYDEEEDEFDISYQMKGASKKTSDRASNKASNKSSKGHRKSGFAEIMEMLVQHFSNMQAFDYVLTAMTVLILIVAIVAGRGFITFNKVESQMNEIVPVGTQLSQVGIIGESGLLAMADAKAGAAAWSEEIEEIETETQEVEESQDYENVKVSVGFESVEKDLKIRFRNANTGEYIKGIVFEVTLTGPTGNTLVVKDEDKDGVIYVNGLRAGNFTAVVTSTDKFQFPSSGQKVTVKDKVEYVVVNVDDEVKKENQVNASKEDTAQVVAKQEEVVLKDTVEWVESSKTAIGGSETYKQVDKSTIADPSLSTSAKASSHKFDNLEVSVDPATLTMQVGGNATIKGKEFQDYSDDTTTKTYKISWTSSEPGIATVENGNVKALKSGTTTITYTVEETIRTKVEKTGEPTKKEVEKTTEISEEEYKEKYENSEEASSWKRREDADKVSYVKTEIVVEEVPGEKSTVEEEKVNKGSATCTVTVEAAKIASATFEIAKTADSCTVGSTLTVCPAKLIYTKTDNSTETITSGFPAITWSSSDVNIAKVDEKGVVTGVKKGQVTITGKIAGIKDKDGKELDIKASTTVTINDAAALTIKLDSTERQVKVNDSTTLAATVTNYKNDNGVTWASSDTKLATVDAKGVVKMLKAGKVTITATTKEKDVTTGKQVSASCTITIVTNAMADRTTKLKDKNGNQIYIKRDGKYIEAVFADYYTENAFYINEGAQYKYTGWQTVNGKTYYYDKNGKPVTGAQIIKGVTYNFGADGAIQTNVNGASFGIDVSKWNGKIDWSAVKASGVNFVIIRCGYRGSSSGALIEDPLFRQNIQGASAAGIKVGLYFFSQAINEVEAVKEASFAVERAKTYGISYPIFIDTEPSGGRADRLDKATRTAVVNAFCKTVTDAGYKAGVYTSKSWFENKLQTGSLNQYKIWLAQYAAKPTYGGKYDMWQYSHKGTISGIKGNVDLNYSYLGY